jgi:hypothetical protein
MYKKILVSICCVVLVSKTVSSQIVSVEGVSHADTVQYAAPFSLHFWFVNTGNTSLFMDSITANISISPVSVIPPNWQILTFTQNIPQGIFAPGDSIFMLNTVLNGGPQLYQQAGDNIVVIWPSFITPVTIDTSITPLYVLPNPSAIQEHTTKKELLRTIDVLGREKKGKKNEPLFYIYNDGTVEKRITIE